MRKDKVYHTTYCNHGHSTRDGVPIGHACYVLPVALLEAEMAGDYDKAISVLNTWSSRKPHRGRKAV
jgi:hypothetical protein